MERLLDRPRDAPRGAPDRQQRIDVYLRYPAGRPRATGSSSSSAETRGGLCRCRRTPAARPGPDGRRAEIPGVAVRPLPRPASSRWPRATSGSGRSGHGGIGVVFKARDRELDEVVAIKVLSPSVERDESALLARFKREIQPQPEDQAPQRRADVRLRRQRRLPVHHDGVHRRQDLWTLVGGRRPVPRRGGGPDPAADRARDRGDPPARDPSPRHEVAERPRRPRRGPSPSSTSAWRGCLRPGLTLSSMLLGTPQYMSPEQALGTELDEGADLYAIGVVAWEILTGRTPVRRRFPRRHGDAARERAAFPITSDGRRGSPTVSARSWRSALEKDREAALRHRPRDGGRPRRAGAASARRPPRLLPRRTPAAPTSRRRSTPSSLPVRRPPVPARRPRSPRGRPSSASRRPRGAPVVLVVSDDVREPPEPRHRRLHDRLPDGRGAERPRGARGPAQGPRRPRPDGRGAAGRSTASTSPASSSRSPALAATPSSSSPEAPAAASSPSPSSRGRPTSSRTRRLSVALGPLLWELLTRRGFTAPGPDSRPA